jgi:hypothetical protein
VKRLLTALVAASAALLLASAGGTRGTKEGGTFLVAEPALNIGSIDAAVAFTPALAPACST